MAECAEIAYAVFLGQNLSSLLVIFGTSVQDGRHDQICWKALREYFSGTVKQTELKIHARQSCSDLQK